MVLAVNRFFEPDCKKEHDDRLTLWQSHRYDVRAPTAFVSLYYQSADGMQVVGPKLAEWVTAWLPEDMVCVNEFSVATVDHLGHPTRLSIDREVYLTLREAAVGLGRSTWSRRRCSKDHAIRRRVAPSISRTQAPLGSGNPQRRHQPAHETAGPPRARQVRAMTEFDTPSQLLRRIYDEEFRVSPHQRFDEACSRCERLSTPAYRYHH